MGVLGPVTDATSLGGLLGGLLVTGLGLWWAMLAVGVAYLAVTMLPAVDPRWRELDRRRT